MNTGLRNRKLRSALKCTVLSQCTPVPEDRQAMPRADRRTDEHHGNSATIRDKKTSEHDNLKLNWSKSFEIVFIRPRHRREVRVSHHRRWSCTNQICQDAGTGSDWRSVENQTRLRTAQCMRTVSVCYRPLGPHGLPTEAIYVTFQAIL